MYVTKYNSSLHLQNDKISFERPIGKQDCKYSYLYCKDEYNKNHYIFWNDTAPKIGTGFFKIWTIRSYPLMEFISLSTEEGSYLLQVEGLCNKSGIINLRKTDNDIILVLKLDKSSSNNKTSWFGGYEELQFSKISDMSDIFCDLKDISNNLKDVAVYLNQTNDYSSKLIKHLTTYLIITITLFILFMLMQCTWTCTKSLLRRKQRNIHYSEDKSKNDKGHNNHEVKFYKDPTNCVLKSSDNCRQLNESVIDNNLYSIESYVV